MATYKTINLQEWESFGGGGYGESFYNKMDDSVILKLNKSSVSAQKAQEEFRRSKTWGFLRLSLTNSLPTVSAMV